jgi:glycosyltransferase involved in cell wall biosynthesis
VVLEAFAAGLPVVATAVGGTPEVVDDGVNGRLVPPGDPTSLALRVAETLGDDRARRAMGDRGRDLVSERFTFSRQAAAYRGVFESLTRPSRRAEVAGI